MNNRRHIPAVRRLLRVWREMDYAQRRMFEVQTGVSVADPRKRS